MLEVIHAKHRKEYFQLAFKYFTSPQHVWNLAHGKHSKTEKDRNIKHDLVDLGIIHRHKHRDFYDQEKESKDNDE